jgi:hypothetical protein
MKGETKMSNYNSGNQNKIFDSNVNVKLEAPTKAASSNGGDSGPVDVILMDPHSIGPSVRE